MLRQRTAVTLAIGGIFFFFLLPHEREIVDRRQQTEPEHTIIYFHEGASRRFMADIS